MTCGPVGADSSAVALGFACFMDMEQPANSSKAPTMQKASNCLADLPLQGTRCMRKLII
ncbi:MAG: hypothetical protein R2709_15105 [Marmoricola sp.]